MSQLVTEWEAIRRRHKRLTCSRLTQQRAGRRCREAIEERRPTRSERGKKGRRKRSPLARAEIVKYGCSKPSFKQKRVGGRKHGHSFCGAYYAPMRKSAHLGGVNSTIGIGRQDEEWEAGSTSVLVEV